MRIVLFLLVALFICAPDAHARSEGIAAVVNQDVISSTDLNDRMDMIMSAAGLPRTQEVADKLTGQVLNDLVEEQLKMQEASRLNISVTDEEIEQGFATLAGQNKFTSEQFREVIKRSGINVATIQRQIRAQLLWMKVIQEEMRPKVNVTDTDIDQYLERFNGNKGKPEYLVAEIFLPVSEQNPDAVARQLGERLVKEIRAGAPFSKVAQQFSGAAGASKGGDRGWVQQGQMDPELDAALLALEKGTLSDPIRAKDGYHILFVRDARTVSDETIPTRDAAFSTIGIQRLERMQARTLLDLKTTAFIENRAGT